jgi:3-methyl-2-oxobutanoate hydroxymethyltransferase
MLTIGIGAGASTAGQVLVMHDMLGLTTGKRPRFVRDFTRAAAPEGAVSILSTVQAVKAYVADVKAGSFPDEAVHGY